MGREVALPLFVAGAVALLVARCWAGTREGSKVPWGQRIAFVQAATIKIQLELGRCVYT